jgi:WD40 repeat protein/transcriptional regulator with XRE-family HTH domain
VNRPSYGKRDYAFGQVILTLRTTIGLTQAGLAEVLHVSRHTVTEWEAGGNYPSVDHLKRLIELGVRQQAFPAGREAEEIRALWQAARQKVLLDEAWLTALLARPQPSPGFAPPGPIEQNAAGTQAATQSAKGARMDWGEALAVPSFYGRERELAQLSEWVLQERCRVVSVLGLGGIGKSALAITLMHQLAPHFEVLIWRSLRDAPECSAWLSDCLQVLAPEPLADVPASLDGRLGLLLEHLRERRTLLVLDNLEALLEEGVSVGRLRTGYEDYARLLRRVAETRHQGCLLLTGREKPGDLVPLESGRAPVRALRLEGLERDAGEQLLEERDLMGSAAEREHLVSRYAGNPLALRIVAQAIVELFGGEIAPFLEQGEVVFGGVRDLLAEQFARLSAGERTLLLWLAVLREPVTLEELLAVLGTPLPRMQALEAVEALRRRSLVERGHRPGSFTLQSVVQEYATVRLIDEAASEVEAGQLSRLIEHGLELAGAREYVRQTQTRLLVVPLLAHLRRRYQGRGEVEEHLRALLAQLRERADYAQGYGPANVLALLRAERGHLRGLDLSQLAIRGASLQGVQMQDASLSRALLQQSVLTEAFDIPWAVAISRSGYYWAAGSKRGEVRVWREAGHTLHLAWQAHTDIVVPLSFSPDERTLASGSLDGSLKLWDVESGAPLWTVGPLNGVLSLAFAPDGRTLASGGFDATVRLWDPRLGTPLQDMLHPGAVFSLAWTPDGRLLASGDVAGTVRLWELQPGRPARCLQTLEEHSSLVRGLAFAPDGSRLASASFDGSVKLWDVESGRCLQTLKRHTERVFAIAWSPDGRTLASGGIDHTIWMWDAHQDRFRVALQGHAADVYDLAFTPDSRHLLSCSPDGTLRLWEVEREQCVRVLQGYTAVLFDVDWSPDGVQLASASLDSVVSLWQVAGRGGGTPPRVLLGHGWTVSGVGWHPDGGVLASSGWDNAIRLWDPASGRCLEVIGDRDHPDTLFFSVAWSPDGTRLASGTFVHGVLMWDVTTRSPRWAGRADTTWIHRVAFSPDGTRLVGGGEDGHVYVWDVADGRLLLQLAGHHGDIMGPS